MTQDLLTAVDSRETGLADYIDFSHPDLFQKTAVFGDFIKDARARGHETYFRHIQEYAGTNTFVDGENRSDREQKIIMCSADYLGLTRHEKVLEGAQDALRRFGASVCSVPLEQIK